MPKLTPLKWLLLTAALAFYTFAVVALTRDYYLRHPPRVATTAVSAPATPPRQRTFIDDAINPSPGTIPTAAGDDPAALDRQADALFTERRFAEAIPVYRRLLALSPGNVEAANDLALALHYTGHGAEALPLLREAVGRAPDFQRGWLTLGFVSVRAGTPAEAQAALTRARDLAPTNPIGQEATRLLGLLQREGG